jgi:hypothetical protein
MCLNLTSTADLLVETQSQLAHDGREIETFDRPFYFLTPSWPSTDPTVTPHYRAPATYMRESTAHIYTSEQHRVKESQNPECSNSNKKT